jgi:metal-dependent amidase/aminoacylase/carboxypeptidase family protein
VLRCFEAGALATGASMDVVADQRPYAEMRHDPDLLGAYRRNAEALGRRLRDDDGGRRMPVSTDMGNVSRALPSIHPSISIDSLPAVNHQAEFTTHCVSPAAEQALLDGAVAMAWTAVDAATDRRLHARLLAGQPPVAP